MSVLERLRGKVPAGAWSALARMRTNALWGYYAFQDGVDTVLGINRDSLRPPRRLFFLKSGVGGYEQVGNRYSHYFQTLGNLQPDEAILDVGCGIGCMAAPLTQYVSERGSYDGFDIDADSIDWCQKNISTKFPNFRFRTVDVFNLLYNPQGQVQPEEFRFPWDDESFDFVFASSVFTHLLTATAERYVSEISRVLRPGGRCLTTWFFLNDAVRERMSKFRSAINFCGELEGCWTSSLSVPERAIAFDEADVRGWHNRHGLTLSEPIQYGTWSGESGLDLQDILVASR